jgi:hypothetical protein
MSGKCEDCLHWHPTDEELEGICRLITEGGRIGTKGRGKAYPFASKLALVTVGDRRHIDCKLRTSAGFGCVQFEAK